MNFVPKDKHDFRAVELATRLGFPQINHAIPDFLNWMQDINWPVAPKIAVLLSGSGPEILPHLRAIFRSDDSVWKHSLLRFLCPHLQPDIQAELVSDLEKLATHPTRNDQLEEVDVIAKEILARIEKNQTTHTK